MRRTFLPRAALAGTALIAVTALGLSCTPAHLPDGEDPQGVCGDGRVLGDELCDDGNRDSGDGCSADCQPEIPPNCGDGVLVPEEGEECDDGNLDGGDGCGAGCWIEGCGNNFLDPGEACEDGNNVAGDGCSADCKSDESCGNGIIDDVVGEICDDGNDDDTDNCPASCEPATCGDGFVQKGIESCDDGNGVAEDGCTDCILDSCGDANLDDGEECDQGAANGSDGSSCFRTCLVTDVVMEPAFDDRFVSATRIARSVNAADVNGDGRLDAVIIASSTTGAVALGRGDGTLSVPNVRNLSTGVVSSTLADVNADGILDVIAADSSSNRIIGALGEEKGFVGTTINASTIVDVGGENPAHLAVGEVTGDGNVDIVTANQTSNDITVLEGDGLGGFTAIARFGVQSGAGGQGVARIALGDITGDGVLDVVTANRTTSDVAVLEGLGSGSFGPPEIHSTVLGAQGTTPDDLILADVTNDGKLDVLTVNSGSSDVTVLAQQNGTLASPLAFATFDGDAGVGPRALAVGDLNKDGVPDLVTANNADISVLFGLGAGVAFGAPQIIEIGATNNREITVADLNADNTLDIIVSNVSSLRDVRVLVGNGDGTFAPPTAAHHDINGSAVNAVGLHVDDVDDDGRRDVVVVTSSGASVLAGDGQGRLLPPTQFQAGGFFAGVGDLDGDGDLDLVSPLDSSVAFLRLINGENGRFTATSESISTGNFVSAMALGDFDGDQNLDAAGLAVTEMSLNRGLGTGDFTPFSPATITINNTTGNVVAADISGDSEIDLVFSDPDSQEVGVSIGDGAGGFTNPAPLPTQVGNSGRTPVQVTVADIDGEMGPDIITANASTADVSVIRSTGSGTFAATKIVPAVFGGEPADTRSIAAGDFNGDGLVDLATANLARGTVSVIIGFGNGNFAAPQTFTVEEASAVSVGDFDKDGLQDVLVGTENGRVLVLLGKGHP